MEHTKPTHCPYTRLRQLRQHWIFRYRAADLASMVQDATAKLKSKVKHWEDALKDATAVTTTSEAGAHSVTTLSFNLSYEQQCRDKIEHLRSKIRQLNSFGFIFSEESHPDDLFELTMDDIEFFSGE